MAALGKRLRSTRVARGLNLTDAAREVGVARTAYRLWEKDAAIPAPEHWKTIAFWCDVPLATILRELGILSAEEEKALLRMAVRHLRTKA